MCFHRPRRYLRGMVVTDTEHPRLAAPPLMPPPARRQGPRRWLSPQLVIGALLVLVSVVVGARLIGAADETTPVLAAVDDLAPGQPLTAESVQVREVDLGDSGELYHAGSVGAGYVVVEPVHAGELLPRSAVVPVDELPDDAQALRYVTVSLPAAELPATVGPGSTVDVWLVPASTTGGTGTEVTERRAAKPLAREVTVTAIAGTDAALAVDGSQASVTLAIAASTVAAKDGGASPIDDLVARLVGAAREGGLYLVEVPTAERG